ncbi:MAG: zf-TFIIB domain-containing protein [Candidatus Sericytochromatia bacterium]
MSNRSKAEAPPRVLDCPRCEVPLSRREVTTAGEGWQVEVDVCVDSCGGVWIDKEDFHVDPSANLVLNKALVALNFPALKGLAPEAEAECPVCRVGMVPYHWKHTDVELDRCGQCRGLWFDGNEVAAVQTQLRHAGRQSAVPARAPAPRVNRQLNRIVWIMGLAVVAVALLVFSGVLKLR